MIDNLPPIKVFAGTKSQYMAKEICRELGCELGKMNIQYFADGEFEVSLRNPFVDARYTSCNPHSRIPTTSWSFCL